MTLEVDVQIASEDDDLPDAAQLCAWADAAAANLCKDAELTIRIVDEHESAQLNETYRHKSGATNVLSFPFEAPPGVSLSLLGDVVICASIVKREAREQSKDSSAHWAHMVVHGVLHLLGYDHETPAESEQMEAQETRILGALGFGNPYDSRCIS